jgi:serine/threonine-protein kinase
MALFEELKRRNVIRVAGLYLVGAWLLVQVAGTLLPWFGVGPSVLRGLVVALGLGFVGALVFAWAFEVTPDGIRRDADVPPGQAFGAQAARRMEHAIVVLLLLAVGYFCVDKFVLAPKREAAATRAAMAAATTARASPAAEPPSSIAVLPFVDMSQDKDQEYFSDGLSEQLLNELAQLPGLHVAGRTSSFYFKGRNEDLRVIGRRLNVATVLEGSVAKSGNTLRVTAQLINAADGYHLWSHTYDREFKDVFALQDEIAGAVVDALKLKLLPGQAPTSGRRVDPRAYDQFLVGRKLAHEQSLAGWTKAVAAYRKALAIDPGYAAAQAALADILYETSYFSSDAATVIARQDEARRVLEGALRLDPSLADAYRVRSRIRSETLFEVADAIADIRRGLALNPNDPDILGQAARLFTVTGNFRDAQAVVERGLAIDPLSTDALLARAELRLALGQWAGSREDYQRILDIAPDSTYAMSGLVQAWLCDGQPRAAAAAIRGPADNARTLYARALAEYTLGHRAAADQALAEMSRRYAAGWAYQIAVVHAWRGDVDAAMAWLERGFEQRDGGLLRMDTEPMLANVRKDPRYPALRKKVGLGP